MAKVEIVGRVVSNKMTKSVVVSAEREPGRLMSDLKARASRELNRSGTDANEKRWARHGSTRHLLDEATVAAAVAYTLDEQGSPMAVYRGL